MNLYAGGRTRTDSLLYGKIQQQLATLGVCSHQKLEQLWEMYRSRHSHLVSLAKLVDLVVSGMGS